MAKLKFKSHGNYSENAPQESASQESWNDYLQRNSHQFLSNLWAIPRSGLGAGGVAEKALEEANAPEWSKTLQRWILPSPEKAREGYGNFQSLQDRQKAKFANLRHGTLNEAFDVLLNRSEGKKIAPQNVRSPEYFYQSRPGDEYLQHGAQFLGSTALGAALGGPAGAAYGALGHLGALGGSYAGGELGREIGAEVGFPKTGQEIGGIAGGFAGAHYVPKAAAKYVNRPSKGMYPEAKEAAEQEYLRAAAAEEEDVATARKAEQEGVSTARAAEEEGLQGIAAKEQEATHIDNAAEKQALGQLRTKHNEELAANRAALEEVNKKVAEYEAKIKTTKAGQEPLYTEAKGLEAGAIGESQVVKNAVNSAIDSLGVAVDQADQALVRQVLQGLQTDLKSGKLSINKSKLYAQRLNDQIYNHNVSRTVKNILGPVKESLLDHIEQIGSKEHAAIYKPARQATRTYKKLGEEKKSFIAEQKAEQARLKADRADIKRRQAQETSDLKADYKEKRQARQNELKHERALSERDLRERREATQQGHKQKTTETKQAHEKEVQKAKETKQTLSAFDKKKIDAVNDIVHNPNVQAFGLGALAAFFKGSTTGAVLAGLSKAFRIYQRESGIAATVFETHPAIHAKWTKMVNDIPKLSKPQIVAAVNTLGKETEKAAKEDEKFVRKGKLKIKS